MYVHLNMCIYTHTSREREGDRSAELDDKPLVAHICICTVYTCICIRTHMQIEKCKHMCINAGVQTFIDKYMCVYAYIYICIYIHIYTYTYIHKHYTFVYVCLSVCTYACMERYVCMYVCVPASSCYNL